MKNNWMIRSGSGSQYIEEFAAGWAGIDFNIEEDLNNFKSNDEIRNRLDSNADEFREGAKPGIASMLLKIKEGIRVGDNVVTYDKNGREYLVGQVTGEYQYDGKEGAFFRHKRAVQWDADRVSRDNLRAATRNSLGSVLTIFSLTEEIWNDIRKAQKGQVTHDDPKINAEDKSEDSELKKTQQDTAHEALKDRIVRLDPDDMERLLASLLTAMGFRATVSPKGPDRGVDLTASPDGLGLQEPRIKAEVKHRKKTRIGAPDIRSFIGGLRPGDRGIYLSTGGFTKEAHYEAERANIPTTLLDLDRLAILIEANYESFDNQGRALLPLTRIYWPAD